MGRRFAVYVAVPSVVTLGLIAMYFSGVPWLQHIVSPNIAGLHPDSNRELGLLENLQNVCLIVMAATALLACRRKPHRVEKAVWGVLAAFSLFVLLEEMDYGLHFYELAASVTFDKATQVRNVHNTFDLTNIMKNGALAGMIFLFVVFPLAFTNSRNPLLRYITPDRFAIGTMVAMFALRTLAHWLRDQGVGGAGTISKNISEFRELITYYLFMVYLLEVAFRRRYPGAPARAGSAPLDSGPASV
ncbi:MAG: hypothetical protein JXR94_05820 [Candidatus Hydrogenedentes bacterium]|nr:hypothetical protein [Candidatus Hydrogenedentota bacterium]